MIQIIVDSGTDLREGLAGKLTVVPMSIRFGTADYLDGVDIDRTRFYQMLIESDALPATSQATPAAFAKVLKPVMAAGDQALIITISGKLSGTCQSAMLAAADWPDRVMVVDSESVAMGSGILTE